VTESGESIQKFFDDYYADYQANPEWQRWRVLLAQVNAGKIDRLLDQAGDRPSANVVELGCGGGELLAELSRRDVGESYVAYEISRSAVDYVRSQAISGVRAVEVYDGSRTPEQDGSFDLAIVSHVIEHAHDPVGVLREARRLAPTVAVQIVLADTLPARRSAHRREVSRTGHINEYNLASARAAVRSAGLEVVADIVTHPGRKLRTYWNRSARARAIAFAVDASFAVIPSVARRLFAGDYTAICAG
jgi:SAM-dependent methyltransferase